MYRRGAEESSPSYSTLKKSESEMGWCCGREGGIWGGWRDFCPQHRPPMAPVLASKAIRRAEVWAPASWNEGGGGGQGCQSCGPRHPPLGCPLYYAWSHAALPSFLLANHLKRFPMVGGGAAEGAAGSLACL